VRARAWHVAAIETTSLLRAEGTGGHVGTMSLSAYRSLPERQLIHRRLVDEVRHMASIAASLGQAYYLWELMPSALEPPHAPDEAIHLLSAANDDTPIPVRLCFDLGHCCAWALTRPGVPEAWLEETLPHVQVIHLQQTDGHADRHWPFSERHHARGIVDPAGIVNIARDSPLERVDLVLELGHDVSTPPADLVDDYKESVAAWAPFIL